MANSPEHERVLELQDHIIGTENVAEFLQRLSIMAAAALSRAMPEVLQNLLQE